VQSEPLLDLVNTLNEIIDTQFKDLLRALVDRGQYRVADSHTQFRVAKTTWTNKTQEERQRYFRRFRNFVPKDKLTATSTDGKMTVTGIPFVVREKSYLNIIENILSTQNTSNIVTTKVHNIILF
jgi:hypothetical protein